MTISSLAKPGLLEGRPVRSLAVLAFGAAAGLIIAGFGLFTAKGTSTRSVPPDCVALVNQRPILKVDFEAQLRTLYGVGVQEATAEQRRKVLDDMIREELFVQRGLELDFPESDPDTRAALVAAVEQQVVADVTARQPSETDLRSFYDTHRAKYSSDGTMIVYDLTGPPANARVAADAIRQGAQLPDVATRYGFKDSGKTSGEEFYFAAQAHLGEVLFNTALPLADGQVSDPLAVEGVTHVLVMARNARPVALPFEKEREQVSGDYRKEAEAHLERADETYLRDKADILVAPELR